MLKMAEIKLTAENFEEEVLKSDKPVLVDFWATWCGPCRMLAPVIEEIAAEYAGRVKVGKVNVDEEPVLADHFRISAIPTLFVFKNGQIVQKSMGYRKKEDIVAMIFKD